MQNNHLCELFKCKHFGLRGHWAIQRCKNRIEFTISSIDDNQIGKFFIASKLLYVADVSISMQIQVATARVHHHWQSKPDKIL